MKLFKLIFLLILSQASVAQMKIDISFDKKVILLFESNIDGFELGDNKTVGCLTAENRIILQSPKEWGSDFFETNLLVWTETGHYFTFIIDYNNDPDVFFHVIKNSEATYQDERSIEHKPIEESDNIVGESGITVTSLDSICHGLVKADNYIFTIGSVKKKMELAIGGIYVDDYYIYIETFLYNSGNIKYDIDLVSFFINGKGKNKRKKTAVSKENLLPIYVFNGEIKSLDGGKGLSNVFVFKRFTIDSDKELSIEFFELNGDRNIEATVTSNDLIAAKSAEIFFEKN